MRPYERRGEPRQVGGVGGVGEVGHVLFEDRHPVRNVTGGDDMADQAWGAVEDVGSQDM
jgi:hypothetical protein